MRIFETGQVPWARISKELQNENRRPGAESPYYLWMGEARELLFLEIEPSGKRWLHFAPTNITPYKSCVREEEATLLTGEAHDLAFLYNQIEGTIFELLEDS